MNKAKPQVVCATCSGEINRRPHPGPNYCSTQCEPWIVQDLRKFVSELADLSSEVSQLSNSAVERWCIDALDRTGGRPN